MSTIGQSERETQNRIIALFRDELHYRYLGDRTDFENTNIWEEHLTAWLMKSGCTADQIKRQICISDPFLDMLEGEPPSGSAHGGTVHNDADNISASCNAVHVAAGILRFGSNALVAYRHWRASINCLSVIMISF